MQARSKRYVDVQVHRLVIQIRRKWGCSHTQQAIWLALRRLKDGPQARSSPHVQSVPTLQVQYCKKQTGAVIVDCEQAYQFLGDRDPLLFGQLPAASTSASGLRGFISDGLWLFCTALSLGRLKGTCRGCTHFVPARHLTVRSWALRHLN
jgi:hypothetical protein